MGTRCITLPATGRQVTLASYVRAVQKAKANPDTEFKHGLTTWWPTKGKDIVNQFIKGMHQRINERIPYSDRGK